MRFSATFLQTLAAVPFLLPATLAKARAGYVTLINATPYDWKLSGSHSYQVEWNFPKIVKAGTSYEQYIKFNKDHHDDGAEAFYYLENSPSPASFIIMARPPKHIKIQFQESLASLNNPESSILNLGFVENGAVSFILSGDSGSYISSNPPVGWMQATLSKMRSKTLREIAMPASPDAGMSEVSFSWGGHPHNTQTQTTNIFRQLMNGARIFDIRPTYYKKKFYAGHFARFGNGMVGGTGRKISNIVKDINAFTNQYPGELIILDISHQMDASKNFRNLSPKKWEKFFQEMSKIEALWVPSSDVGDDLSSLPLSKFITPGSKAAVLVRLPDSAPLPGSSANPRSITKRNLAVMDSFAQMDRTDGMMPLGPALSGDDSDNPTATNILTGPTPATLPPDQQAESGGGGNSSTPNDKLNPPDDDTVLPPTSLPSEATIFTIPTELPSSPEVQPIPVSIPLPTLFFSQAFIHASRLPISGSYSDTDKSAHLISDQLSKLARDRPDPQSPPHKSVWTITQKNFVHITDVANKKTSITGLAIYVHRALLGNLWNAMTRNTYPNMIEVDDIRDSQVAALCMAINDYFASSQVERSGTIELGERRRRGLVD
jgi:hypothetical protein